MRRVLLAALAVAAVLVASACSALPGQPASLKLSGRIAWPKDGDLWTIDLAEQNPQPRKITNLPRGAAVTGAAWSPDGQKVAYSQFGRRPGDNVSGADLFVADADGSNARVLVERDVPGGIVETPTWTPNGRLYYTVRRVQNARESLTVYRRMADGGQPEVVAENAFKPAPAPDESFVLFERNTRAGMAIIKKTLGASPSECELLSDNAFPILGVPRVSPDGKRVAFSGSGEMSANASGTCGPVSASQPRLSSLLALGEWLGVVPRSAYAHGLPWDLYGMNVDGGGMAKIAVLQEDEPTVAWSPDGATLAIFGTAALYAVPATGGTPSKIVEGGGYGGLDWTR